MCYFKGLWDLFSDLHVVVIDFIKTPNMAHFHPQTTMDPRQKNDVAYLGARKNRFFCSNSVQHPLSFLDTFYCFVDIPNNGF